MLYLTSKDGAKKKHTHIAYLLEDGTGITSVDNKHSHTISLSLEIPPAQDEFGEVIQEGVPARPVLSEAQGHTHEIEAEIQSEQKDPFTIPEGDTEEGKSVQRVKGVYKEARFIEKDSMDTGVKSEDTYEGNQWDKDLKASLDKADRAALTVNEVEGKIDLLSGVQRQNRMDNRFFPVEGGDQMVADALTALVKHAMDRTHFAETETLVAEDQMIPGRGLFHVDTDFDSDMRGKFTVNRFNWRDVAFGPHENLDGSDADFVIKNKWLSLDKLKQMHPDKADDISIDFQELQKKESRYTDPIIEPENDVYNPEGPGTATTTADGDTTFVNISKKQYLLMECWQKVYARVYLIADAPNNFFDTLVGWSKKEIDRLATINGPAVIPRIIYKFRVTQVAGTVLLEDEFPDLPTIQGEQFYDILPVYAKKRRNTFWGKVKPVIDLQKEINKRHSQGLDILNKVAPHGWFYDETTFTTPAEEAAFVKVAGTPGFKVKVANIEKRPVLQDGINHPTEMAAARAELSAKMKEIMNINAELTGQPGRTLSGEAIKQNKRQGLLGNDFLFDNLGFARRRVALMCVAHIQKYWTVERIMKILGFINQENPDENFEIAGEPFDPQNQGQVETLTRLLKDEDLTTYDVVVSDSQRTPTAMLGDFIMMKELAGQGVPIAPSTLLRMSNIPDKAKALQELAEFSKQQAQAEQEKNETEIRKTQIAQEGRGPQ